MKFKLLKTIVVFSALFMFTLDASAFRVVSREVTGCKAGYCTNTSKTLCTFMTPTGPITGYCITCSGKGSNACPTSITNNNSGGNGDLDSYDLQNGDVLMAYAIGQLNNSVFSGTHQISIIVEGVTRIYEVVWTGTIDGENSTITVDRI